MSEHTCARCAGPIGDLEMPGRTGAGDPCHDRILTCVEVLRGDLGRARMRLQEVTTCYLLGMHLAPDASPGRRRWRAAWGRACEMLPPGSLALRDHAPGGPVP